MFKSSFSRRMAQSSALVALLTSATVSFGANGAESPIRINVGGSQYVDINGNLWSADFGYNTGITATSTSSIANTEDDSIYQTQRYDAYDSKELAYNIDLVNGEYNVKIHLAETYRKTFGTGLRVFSVAAEGEIALNHVDIFDSAGAKTALVLELDAIQVNDGQLNLEFGHIKQNPTIAGIEIVPVPKEVAPELSTTETVVLRVNAGGGGYYDADGNLWEADYGFNTGTNASSNEAIANTIEDTLYQEQHRDFNDDIDLEYAFDIADGNYTVRLHFSENYSGVFGIGKRVFNVLAEGNLALENVDVYKDAGAYNAITYDINNVAVSDGKLNLLFARNQQNPTVAAIEIIAEDEPVIDEEVVETPAEKVVVRVNSGGTSWTDTSGNQWSADFGFNTGTVDKQNLSTEILNTLDDTIYNTQRWNRSSTPELQYSFAVPNGQYAIRLHLSENYSGNFGNGKRVFDVYAEGQAQLYNVDIFQQSGGALTALIVEIPSVEVVDGALNIDFIHVKENPSVAGIEVIELALFDNNSGSNNTDDSTTDTDAGTDTNSGTDNTDSNSSSSGGLVLLGITEQPISTTVDGGQNAVFTVKAESNLGITYQWYHNGAAISGATSDTLVISGTDKSDAGSYYCVVTSFTTEIISATAQLDVNVTYNVSLTWAAPKTRADGSALTTSDIKAYEVYYSDSATGEMTKVAEIPSTESSYSFSDVEAGTHYFALATIDSNDNRSELSTRISKVLE